METALSTINLLPSGREQISTFFAKLKNEIMNTDENPLKILVQLKYAEKVISDILKDNDIENCFIDEFTLYESEKIIELAGAKLQQQDTGIRYDYESSGDPVWLDLDAEIKTLSDKKKEREKFLQALPIDGAVDPDTGIFITKPPRTAKTKIVVRI